MKQISCSWHQTTKQPILFSTKLSQFEQLKKKTNLSLVQNWEKKICFGPINVFFFSCKNWEKFVEKIGKINISCLVIWRHEQDKNHVFPNMYATFNFIATSRISHWLGNCGYRIEDGHYQKTASLFSQHNG